MSFILALVIIGFEACCWRIGRPGTLQRAATMVIILCMSVLFASALSRQLQPVSEACRSSLAKLVTGQNGSDGAVTGEETQNAQSPGPRRAVRAQLDLAMTYDLDLPHLPVMHVAFERENISKAFVSGRLYVRTDSFDYFADRSWLVRKDPIFIYDADDGKPDDTVSLAGSKPEDIRYTVYIRDKLSALPHIFPVVSIDLPVIVKRPNDVLARPISVKGEFIFYRASSRVTTTKDKTDISSDRDVTNSNYLQMPPTPLAERIRSLTQSALRDTSGAIAKIEKLRRFLKSEFEYSLKVMNPDDLHPVENFLFEEKKGHCQLFATAFTLMLRCAGFPARIGVGYCGGEYDEARRIYTFYRDDAHSWTEVYLAGQGWVIVDATPESPLAPAAPRTASLTTSFSPGEAVDLADAIASSSLMSDAAHKKTDSALRLNTYGVVIPAALLILLGIVALFAGRGGSMTTGSMSGRRSALPGYLRTFLRRFARAGHPKKPGETLQEYVHRLKRLGLITGEYDEMTAYTYRVIYEGAERDPPYERRMKIHSPPIPENKARRKANFHWHWPFA